MAIKDVIPSMFHRRLLLLLMVSLAPVAAVGTQLVRLTVVRGEELREEAEARLVSRSWTPTVRGRILDRKGRVLAQDRPSYDVAVDYRVISGAWAETRAGELARRMHSDEWPELDGDQRSELIERYAPAYRAHLDAMWQLFCETASIERAELDERRDEVVGRVGRMFATIVTRRREQLEQEMAKGRELTTELEERIERQAARPIREQREAHALVNRVPDDVAFVFRSQAAREVVIDELVAMGVPTERATVPLMPGLDVPGAGARVYPFERMSAELDMSTLPSPVRREGTASVPIDGPAVHLLGWMRDSVFAEDHAHRVSRADADEAFATRVLAPDGTDRGGYRTGDLIGAAGIETSWEDDLRGLRGLTVTKLESGEVETTSAEPGADLELSIDIALQARVIAAMDPEIGLASVQPWHGEPRESMPYGTALYGAAVVLEIATGEALAMVSTPTFTRDQLQADPASVFEDPIATPHINRAIAVPYQPGSIVKPLVYCHAVRNGLSGLQERIVCPGHFLEGRPNILRCWTFRERFGFMTHSSMYYGSQGSPDVAGLTPEEAIMGSCNIYFYELGERLNKQGSLDLYGSYGVGAPFNLGVGIEHAGRVGPGGDPERMEYRDPTFLGIGQGPVDWTPLHAAESYAALARGGIKLNPKVVRDGLPPTLENLHLDQHSVDIALEGLRMSVEDSRGTGHHIALDDGLQEPIFNAPGISLWGKTGTAQASPRVFDPDGEGPEAARTVREGEHSWFVVLVGPEGSAPLYSVAVVMEYAGSGGRVSGPIVNQILHALIAEGYL